MFGSNFVKLNIGIDAGKHRTRSKYQKSAKLGDAVKCINIHSRLQHNPKTESSVYHIPYQAETKTLFFKNIQVAS
jgi:hypothetical protein